ncbi:HCP-like protein [Backusella circina FSU 941]|nr:HCP-like protein [Backusella circina FSU 941]
MFSINMFSCFKLAKCSSKQTMESEKSKHKALMKRHKIEKDVLKAIYSPKKETIEQHVYLQTYSTAYAREHTGALLPLEGMQFSGDQKISTRINDTVHRSSFSELSMNLAKLLVDIPDLDPNILKKAEQGDPFVQCDIGETYCLKTNLADNYKNAFYWLHLAGQQRNIKAQFILGDLYALGKGIERNESMAYQWYMKSAIQGYPKALTRLHNLYHTEKSMYCRGQRNADEEEWTQPKFKEQNKIRELFEYRVEQMANELTKAQAYFSDQFRDCQKQNTVEAQLTLGFLYQHGYGIRKITSRAIEFYTLAANEGNTDAQYNLASIYHTHYDMKWNYREAFKWYTKAAESGSMYAQSGLALLYQKGLGVDIDYSKTVYWYTKAAEMHNVQAQISLGCIYRKGDIVDQDHIKAVAWYKAAVMEGSQVGQTCLDLLASNSSTNDDGDAGRLLEEAPLKMDFKRGLCSKLRDDVETIIEPAKSENLKKLAMKALKKDGNAMFEIGLTYYRGGQFKQDKDTAFRWIRKAAKAKLVKAQCFIAEMYKEGDCVEQDYPKSSIWYTTAAAKKRESTARYCLGQMYYQGLGVRKDPLEASRWYTLAAERKHNDAQCQLGLLREKGQGLRQETREAVQMYMALVKQKHPEAIYRLATMYEHGNGVDSDFQRALFLYKVAARRGYVDAQLKLGQLYFDSDSSIFSFENALKYYKMAVKQNNPEAKYRLGLMYLDGNGVDQDWIRAYKLFTKSKELHYESAECIFRVPIDYEKSRDIDYEKLVAMFILICNNDLSDLEYNLGYHFEHETTYIYKIHAFENVRRLNLAKEWYEKGASKNNQKAQYRLGLMYETGKDASPNWIKALEYYEKARENGNTDAANKLAYMYLNGYGVCQNYQKAFDYMTEASYKGPGEAVNLLLQSYETTKEKEHASRKKILEEVAKSGNIVIQYQLGMLHLNTEPPNHNTIQEGIKWLSRASEGGYIEASYQLGILYEEGTKIPQNCEEASRLYQIAARKGCRNASYCLAQLYHHGNGIACDYRKAFELYNLAAKHGNQLGGLAIKITSKSIWENLKQKLEDIKTITFDYYHCLKMWQYVVEFKTPDLKYRLGRAYEEMRSSSDLSQAKEWYSKSVKRSHGPSFFRLGRLFDLGIGVKQDYKKAIELYNQSTMSDNTDALCALGSIYQHGKGVKPSLSTSFDYYKKAAERGDRKAQFILGTMYEKGRVEDRNFLEAVKWFSTAASQGSEEAHSYLNTFYEYNNTDDQFSYKSLLFLSKLIKLERYITAPERTFIGEIHFRLGYYEKAWSYFSTSHEKYGESRAAIFLKVDSEDQNASMKAGYLKKLDMWETVVHCLKKEDIYELGMIYYYGVYESVNEPESDKLNAIVEPDVLKSAKYFKMVIDKELPDDNQYYGYSSYYLGMTNYLGIEHKIKEKALYYLCNAILGGYPTAKSLLKSINRNEKITVYKTIMHWHQENQSSSNPNIIYNIGYMYANGIGVFVDTENAAKYYKMAADQGHARAQNNLANMYAGGIGIEKDAISAIRLYEKASEQNPVANFNLGNVYFYGQGVKENYPKALEYYRVAATQGDSDAQSQLGFMYRYGYGTEKDIVSSIQWYEKAANQNNISANTNLGDIYMGDQDIEKNYTKAFEYYLFSANQGDVNAQFNLGGMYYQGNGTEKNIKSSIEWFTKAADQNDIYASYDLGSIYFEKKEYTKAFHYYKIAADQEYMGARFQIGYCYFYGYGCDKDEDKGLALMEQNTDKSEISFAILAEIYHSAGPKHQNFVKALECYQNASTGSQINYALRGIGLLYEHGDGVDQSYQEALAYYQKAASETNKGASYNIALLYYYGNGVNKDYAISYEWFTKVIKENVTGYSEYVCVLTKKCDEANSEIQKVYSIEPESFIYGETHYFLGMMSKNGQGTTVDRKKAEEHLKMAISYGCVKAKHLQL